MRNTDFFSAGKISKNKGTSVNIFSATNERKDPQGKNLDLFLLQTVKIAFFRMTNLTQGYTKSGNILKNQGSLL